MQLSETSVTGIRTTVISFRRPFGGLRFTLFPMIHMGHAEYYRAVADRLWNCVAIVAEQYDGPSSTGLAFTTAARLSRQLIAAPLVPQDIDYGRYGVPVIFPDGTNGFSDYPAREMPNRRLALLSAPFLALLMSLVGRECLLDCAISTDDDDYLEDERRDDLLVNTLREIDGEFAAEDMEVAVVYGAAHMPAVVHWLAGTGYRVMPGAHWLTAIEF